MLSLVYLPVLLLTSFAIGSPIDHGDLCQGAKLIATQFIGQNKDVRFDHISCDTIAPGPEVHVAIESSFLFPAPQPVIPNVCGANCATHCFNPSGGGPDPNECHVIADALRFDSQNIGTIFTVANGTNNILSLTYSSCTSFFLNQASTSLNYCRKDFASLIDWLAPNCQATQNAHGGLCVANDGRWFVQVQHS